ncbi:hypothetical protein DD238_000342 [Peronospora effusa]|uniref:Uncharacterized protein n=1 Tax=Peronospora effusa TaxID=542832 RepID=A0A3M6VLT1_9STRA|nr:hypothetical protein DD238_000342 [Peronospora effusa]
MQPPSLSICNNFAAESVIKLTGGGDLVLENNSSFWRSASKTDDDVPQSNEWIVCQFSTPVTLSSIELKWHPDYLPEQFSLGISRYNMSYDTVAVVVASTTESRILIPKGTLVTSIKITMMSVNASGK